MAHGTDDDGFTFSPNLKLTAQSDRMRSASSEGRRVGSTDAVAHQAALAFARRVLTELPARMIRTHELSVAGRQTSNWSSMFSATPAHLFQRRLVSAVRGLSG
jgi:hypothetical protein